LRSESGLSSDTRAFVRQSAEFSRQSGHCHRLRDFNFPALSLLGLIQTCHLGHWVEFLSGVGLMFLWSSFIAWFFWRAVGTFQGDDEPDDRRGQYDWVGFRVRFVIGFVIGVLVGWRFVRHSTSMKTLLIASIVTGIIGGLIYGLSRPPDFWSRS
jgi:hypothetical protein